MGKNHDRFREKNIAVFKRVCKKNGIRMTPQRLAIFLEVADSMNHPSAEDVYNAVREKLPTISLDTVYRTLSTFDQCGLIAKVHLIRDKTRFDPNTTHHHHIVCVRCKAVADFQWPELDEAPIPKSLEGWGRVDTKHLQILGACSKCLAQRAENSEEPNSQEES